MILVLLKWIFYILRQNICAIFHWYAHTYIHTHRGVFLLIILIYYLISLFIFTFSYNLLCLHMPGSVLGISHIFSNFCKNTERALCSVPLVYVPVFMPVPGCCDYSGLVIQFDIRYCDPSCFVLLSQNCCSYLGSFVVPYEFLKCLFYICEICHWYFNRDCIESINHFG